MAAAAHKMVYESAHHAVDKKDVKIYNGNLKAFVLCLEISEIFHRKPFFFARQTLCIFNDD